MIRNTILSTLRAIRKVVRKMGYDLVRYNQYKLDVYCSLLSEEVLQAKPFYNVGASNFWHPYWQNIDYVSDWYEDFQTDVIHHDLMSDKDLPISAGSAKVIYTSHTIEHIKEPAVQRFFDQAYLALDNGGVLRVTTGPDAETDYRALLANDEDWYYRDRTYEKKGTYEHIYNAPATSVSLAERWLHHVATQLSRIDISPSDTKLSEKQIWDAIDNYGFPGVLDYLCSLCEVNPQRPGNHVSWWTNEKLIEHLENAGFETVYQSGYGQSASPFLRNSSLFDTTHPQLSIYVEAVKD